MEIVYVRAIVKEIIELRKLEVTIINENHMTVVTIMMENVADGR